MSDYIASSTLQDLAKPQNTGKTFISLCAYLAIRLSYRKNFGGKKVRTVESLAEKTLVHWSPFA